MRKNKCFGHSNGFKHTNLDLSGLENGFDFGIKFIEEPTLVDENYLAEPYLSMWISIRNNKYIPDSICIEYALSRYQWEQSPKYTKPDNDQLLEKAIPQISKLIKGIIKDDIPQLNNGPIFL